MLRSALLALVVLAGCAHSPPPDPASRPLGQDVFPMTAQSGAFDTGRGGVRVFEQRLLPEGGVSMEIEGVGVLADVTRHEDVLYFSDGPALGTPLIHFGATPGQRSQGDGQEILFESWERIEVPAGTYDAARIVVLSGPEEFRNTVTWWFAPNVGLVRLEFDRAGVDIKRLSRTR